MLAHSYYLDKPKGQEPTLVFLSCSCVDGRLRYSLGEKILPNEWQGDGVKNRKHPINTVIARIDGLLIDLGVKRSLSGHPVTKRSVKESIDILLGKVKQEAVADTFFTMFDKIIQNRKNGVELTKGGKRFSEGSITNYKHTGTLLRQFQELTKYHLDMQNFDMDTYRILTNYFTNTLNHSLNNVGRHMKTVKAFLKVGHRMGWHTNTVYLNPDFKIHSEQNNDVYLTIKELETIAALPIHGIDKIARDWFMVEAFTGLRVSDALRLKPFNIAAERITISNEKTDEKVVIPMHPLLKKVLADNGGNWPPDIAEQTINLHIKSIAKLAGIDEDVLFTITRGGERKDEYYKKWEMITNHTGRRSFITNLLRNNANESMVMKMAGIKSPNTLKRYNKMSSAEVADMAAEMPFFQSTPTVVKPLMKIVK